MRAWRAHLKAENAVNVISAAREIEAEVKRFGTMAAAARELRISRVMVSYYMHLLRYLPDEFVNWLATEQDQVVWTYFTERRLRPVAKITDSKQQKAILEEMVAEAVSLKQN